MKITITGADDKTDLNDLAALSEEFPFVEWAFLLSGSRMGQPRYPVWSTLTGLENHHTFKKALHLCGAPAREAMDGAFHPICKLFDRVQVNGWGSAARHAVAGVVRPFEVILQARDAEHLGWCLIDAATIGNASVLFDGSGGRGVVAEWWPPAPETAIPVGYAGGIGPDNVAAVLRELKGRGGWIDMESNVRTNDEFDLQKVYRVLQAAKDVMLG